MWDAFNGGWQPQPWHRNIIQVQAWPYPVFPKIHPHLHMYYVYKGVPICPSTASQGVKPLCIHPIWMWDAVNGGLQPQPWHRNIIQNRPYPVFPKIHPPLHMYYGIRVYPYAHPQHLKVLKHFVYIQYGCGMQSMGVYSLNHDTTTSYTDSAIPTFSLIFTPTCCMRITLRMPDCCLQGIHPCKCKGEGHWWIGNQVLDD